MKKVDLSFKSVTMFEVEELIEQYKKKQISTQELSQGFVKLGGMYLDKDELYVVKGSVLIAFLESVVHFAKKKWWEFWK